MAQSLEVCVDSYLSAVNALKGGADRLEVCSSLALGGLTPSIGFVQTLRENFPEAVLSCMIRPRAGNFVYSENELEVMAKDIAALDKAGADSFVVGVLDSDGNLDKKACQVLMKLTSKPFILHRAFDVANDWKKCLDDAKELGFTTILTSGQQPTAMAGLSTLRDIVEYGKNKGIQIMIGSGVNDNNLEDLAQMLDAQWFHGSASKSVVEETSPNAISMGSAETTTHKVTCPLITRNMKNILNLLHLESMDSEMDFVEPATD